MLVVETIAKIRRAYFIQGKSIKQICRELRVSRNTVRKVVRTGGTEFSYDRSSQPRPKIDPWRSDLDEMLAENARHPRRVRLTLVRIYEELRKQGYDGSYDAVRRYAASWSKATREASADAYVPLSFDPGEAYQFDWSQEVVLIDGVTTTVKVAHVRLCHSRMPFVWAYPAAMVCSAVGGRERKLQFPEITSQIFEGHVNLSCPTRLPAHQPRQVPCQSGSFADEPASQAGCGIDQTHADVPCRAQ